MRNSSIILTFFFFHPKKFALTNNVVLTTYIGLLESSFLGPFFKFIFFPLSTFNIWFIITGLHNLFWHGFHNFIAISHPTSRFSQVNHGWHELIWCASTIFFKKSCHPMRQHLCILKVFRPACITFLTS